MSGSISRWSFSASARKAGSLIVASKARRRMSTRSAGTPGGAATGRAIATAFDMNCATGWRVQALPPFTRSRNSGTCGRSRSLPSSLHQHNVEQAVPDLVRHGGLVAGPGVVAAALDLAALHGEIDVRAALIAVDDLELRAEDGVVDHRAEHRPAGGRCRSRRP